MQDEEGLLKENALLMDVLEAVRTYVNTEEDILSTEQEAAQTLPSCMLVSPCPSHTRVGPVAG